MMSGEEPMRVLLLSRNRVVQELVRMGSRELPGLELEVLGELSGLKHDRYELLLVDERFEGEGELEHLLVQRRVLLGDPERAEAEGYDTVLPKPFLPRDIRRLLEVEAPEEERWEAEERLAFADLEREAETEVLDGEEIRRIRALLDSEESDETEMEKSERSPGGEEVRSLSVDELFELLEGMRPKKLRKLLRGATIHLSIHFPEDA
jgi:hypothetical protein